ncbi:MAG: hypothetical protein V3S01_01185, partial [Dehalococcoidia bacterium]
MAKILMPYTGLPHYQYFDGRTLRSGLGLEPAELEGFTYPHPDSRAQALIQGLGELEPALTAKGGSANDILSPPMRVFSSGIVAGVRSAAGGLPLGELVNLASSIHSLTAATSTKDIGNSVLGLLDATVTVVTTSLKAAGAAASIVAVIPLVGQLIGAVASGIIHLLGAADRYKKKGKDCQKLVSDEWNAHCQKLASEAVSRATTAAGVSPSDLFRPVAVAWQKGDDRLPLTSASIYVALCGRETQGFSTINIDQLNDRYKVQGIDQLTQRRMWALIKSIMAGVEKPTWFDPVGAAPSDQGRATMPILQDIIRKKFDDGAFGDTDAAHRAYVDALSAAITQQYSYSRYCPELIPELET